MKIKPTYEKYYRVLFKRSKDVQATEVVDTTAGELLVKIVETFSGKLHEKGTSKDTIIKIKEVDNSKMTAGNVPFFFTRNGKDFQKPECFVKNLSPREVRILFEMSITDKTE